jgi:uncharacterized protein YrrD
MSKRATDLIGKPIVSADGGQKLGTVRDLLVDDRGVEIIGLVVRQGVFKGEEVLPADAVQTLGPDVVVSRSNELIGPAEWRQQHVASDRIRGHHD